MQRSARLFPWAILLILVASFGVLPAGAQAYDPVAPSTPGPTVTHTGAVVDAKTGSPVVATVEAWTHDGRGRAYERTDTGGRFTIALPQGPGTLVVRAREGTHEVKHHDFTGAKAESFRIELVALPPKTAILEGLVVDAKTGKPVGGAWISLGGLGGASGGSTGNASKPEPAIAFDPCCGHSETARTTTTDVHGRFRIADWGGSYALRIDHASYAAETIDVTLRDGETVSIEAALEPRPERDALVSGVVRDLVTGAPVLYASVSLTNLLWGDTVHANSGGDGSFTARVMPGYTQIWVHAGGSPDVAVMGVASDADVALTRPSDSTGQPYFPWAGTRSLGSGPNSLDVGLTPRPVPSHEVRGYVLDAATGKAIPGAWVSLRNEATGVWGGAETDADGSWKILVHPGYVIVEAYAAGHLSAAVSFLVADGSATRIDLVLPEGESKGGCCYGFGHAAGTGEAPAMERMRDGSAESDAASATFPGSGGNLGPFDGRPVTTPTIEGASRVPPQLLTVPAPGALAALAAAGAALALATRRPRR